ncbi:MAG: cytochrome c biogenesis protein CcsA [Flavobacteriales bacterium]|nr:cytochrome c biogenesis protein CcsA [Flavobacteriales bacterium]MBP9081337.1 cytochrome c biogenesis protein CcsA [Flavobacteriales bacterium]
MAFVGALLSLAAYILHTRTNDTGWRTLGRAAFRVHSLAVVGIVATLFTMLLNHWFAYDYVWKHSNTEMPLRYIASCFWEGQEGSFLLWTFWTMVLGNLLIQSAKTWEGPVVAVFALVQVFLVSMILGIHVFDYRIGNSPFMLIRELPENIGLPWTTLPNYLSIIPQFHDGRGLNPLLQNYWMVIHPPTLFLGFTATLVPFAFAIAGLATGRVKAWMEPALPWTFFGIGILGLGILMGGAWAYEALSFGGFWAWDPVENASLVPWITLVGAGHLMLINKRKDTSLFTTLFLTLITFLLVLYSTFLTRSGVLGDTSVHSFTGEGMMTGLVLFMLSFVALAVAALNPDRVDRWFYVGLSAVIMVLGLSLQVQVPAVILFGAVSMVMTVVAYRKGPFNKHDDEELLSREFWLFIGSLVLLLSAAQITFSTSVPVFNVLLAPFQSVLESLHKATDWAWAHELAQAKLAPPVEAKAHFNKWQIPFAFIVTLLVAIGQYLQYKHTDRSKFFRRLGLSFFGALLITGLCVWLLKYELAEINLIALLFSTLFAALANLLYIPRVLKGKLAKAGPSMAHFGFGLLLLGAVISMSREQKISRNTSGPVLSYLNEDFNDGQDMLLYLGDTVPVGDFYVSFKGKRQEGVNLRYDMDYFASVPQQYAAGDTVRVRNTLFVAKDDHTAGAHFLPDQPAHWAPLETYTRRELWRAPHWSPRQAGAKEFQLEPMVQLNPRFGNVAEPSTKHWPQRDLYTHIRYAKLDSASDGFMPSRLYEKNLGDTIVTPTCIVLLDSVRTVRDSVTIARLGPDFTVFVLDLRVRDLYDEHRWFEAHPVVIYHNNEPVGNKGFELPDLDVKFELATVKGDRIGLNMSEREFVIMQAIVFPGINILWIGIILMTLGTFHAVRQRVLMAKARNGDKALKD